MVGWTRPPVTSAVSTAVWTSLLPSACWRSLDVPSNAGPRQSVLPHVGRQLQSFPRLTDSCILPSRQTPPPREQKDGWMEWTWKVVYWSDVSRHPESDGEDQSGGNIALEKVAERPLKEEKRLVLMIYLVFDIHNPKFALVDCICNPIGSQRRWIIHIFQSRNSGASPSYWPYFKLIRHRCLCRGASMWEGSWFPTPPPVPT